MFSERKASIEVWTWLRELSTDLRILDSDRESDLVLVSCCKELTALRNFDEVTLVLAGILTLSEERDAAIEACSRPREL